MNQQDELAQDIRAVDGSHSLGASELAERLIERGWSRPRVVETVEGLDQLPRRSVIRSGSGAVYEASVAANDRRIWFMVGDECEDYSDGIALPAAVLWVPEEAK